MSRAITITIIVCLTAIVARTPAPAVSAPGAPIKVALDGRQITQSSPAAADFNGNGYKEIVVGGPDGMLYVIAFNGSTWAPVWKRQTALDINAANPSTPHTTNAILSAPAIGDLNNDGRLEIVVTVGGALHHPDLSARRNGGVLVYRYNGEWSFSLMEQAVYNPSTGRCESAGQWRGWPQPCIDQVGAGPGEGYPDGLWDAIQTTPALADLNGDGNLEIIVSGLDRRIHAWRYTGEVLPGWPISQWNGHDLWRGGISSPAVGDLDKDGLPEVVVGTMSPLINGQQDQNATVWAIKGDGSLMPGFPVQTEQHIHSSPALGDLTGDGYLEIVVGTGRGIISGRQNIVYAWRYDGTPLPNWPRVTTNPMVAPPALGDITGDGKMEVVIGGGDCEAVPMTTDNNLYVWRADGSSPPGFPVRPPTPNYGAVTHPMCYSPVLADFDGDGAVEILIVPLGAWGIVTVRSNGTTAALHETLGALYSSPLVDDIDNDGSLEIVIAGSDFFRRDAQGEMAAVWIWKEAGSAGAARPWPMFHHNNQRTGQVPRPPALSFPNEIRLYHPNHAGSQAIVTTHLRNTGTGQFDWELASSTPILHASPTAGSLSTSAAVQLTVDTTGFAEGWTTVGTLTARARINGAEISGSPRVATVRLFIGEVSYTYLPLTLRRHR